MNLKLNNDSCTRDKSEKMCKNVKHNVFAGIIFCFLFRSERNLTPWLAKLYQPRASETDELWTCCSKLHRPIKAVSLHQLKDILLSHFLCLISSVSLFVSTVASPGDPPEISAEAGLCVVIPCNLTADSGFTLESAAWYKCEQNCTDSDIKLSLNNTNSNAQPGSRGRVSLLEPDLAQNNCSIIINDLSGSDSGSYQLSVLNGTMQGFTFHRATITVQGIQCCNVYS